MKRRHGYTLGIFSFLLITILSFQNCSKGIEVSMFSSDGSGKNNGSGNNGGGGPGPIAPVYDYPPGPAEIPPPLGKGKLLTVKKDGSGNFSTIQACANAATAGDTCVVSEGEYSEHVTTKSGGTGEDNRVTFKSEGLVTMQGFELRHSFVTIHGFEVTGYTQAYMGHITIMPGGSNCLVSNNKIRDGAEKVSGINFYVSQGNAPNDCLIRGNILSNLNYTFASVNGSRHTFVGNIFQYLNSRDYIYLFGNGHVFKKNYFRKGTTKPNIGNHPDFVQTFGDNGSASFDMLFEENWIEDLEAQMGQLNSGGIIKGLIPTIHDWVFRRNVFVNTTNNFNTSLPGLVFEHNTFYKAATTQAGLGFGGSLSRGDSSRARLSSNVFLEGGASPDPYGYRGHYSRGRAVLSTEVIKFWVTHEGVAGTDTLSKAILTDLTNNGYTDSNGNLKEKSLAVRSIDELIVAQEFSAYKTDLYDMFVKTVALDKSIKDTFYGDYNFTAGPQAENFPSKREFSEVHGINGGDPNLENLNSPLGPDGIPFTDDDGLHPKKGSILCGRGESGSDIGAFECRK